MNRPCKSVHSFGSLHLFKKENAPEGSTDRCLDCKAESDCAYSALKIYLRPAMAGKTGWPITRVHPEPTEENVTERLRTGPYGKCVYRCSNDVVDHQVVNMEFDNKSTVSFTMTGFTKMDARKTRLFGTKGMLTGDGNKIEVYDFLTEKTREVDTNVGDAGPLGGHGGGDFGLMQAFTKALAENDQSYITSGIDETLESHLIVFKAEESRRNRTVEEIH